MWAATYPTVLLHLRSTYGTAPSLPVLYGTYCASLAHSTGCAPDFARGASPHHAYACVSSSCCPISCFYLAPTHFLLSLFTIDQETNNYHRKTPLISTFLPVYNAEETEEVHQQPTKQDLKSEQNSVPSIVLPFEIRTHPIKGRGLFTTQDLPAYTLLHTAPCIVVSKNEYERHVKHTCFEHYLFHCRSTGNMYLALGYGSLFNHSTRPNINYRIHPENREISYSVGYRPIKRGEELLIYYGSNVWFEDGTEPSNNNKALYEESDDDDGDDFLNRLEL